MRKSKTSKPQVWVVYVEYNEAETPYIVGVFATLDAAEAARNEAIRCHQEEFGHQVYGWDDDDPEVNDGGWDVDIHIEAWEVA